MATETQVKQYLAYWFQLGKKVAIRNGNETLLPNPVFRGNSYSQEFDRCWQRIKTLEAGDCYLEGTRETIAELLTPEWEMILCGRCSLPVPSRTVGMPPESCPCSDLPSWPNNEIPQPRSAIDNQAKLSGIRDRLLSDRNENGQPCYNRHELLSDLPICECPEELQRQLTEREQLTARLRQF